MDQLLLQTVRRLSVGERSGARFGHTYGGPVEVAQLPHRRRRRAPPRGRRNNERGSAQRATVAGKLLVCRLDRAPATGSECSRVQPLAAAESDHLARSDLGHAPYRRWPLLDRKRYQDRAGGHRDKGNPLL